MNAQRAAVVNRLTAELAALRRKRAATPGRRAKHILDRRIKGLEREIAYIQSFETQAAAPA